MAGIIGKKLGMTQLFDDDGNVVAVTVIEAGPCPVTHVRTPEKDGYTAVQLAFEDCKDKHLTKAELGHLKAERALWERREELTAALLARVPELRTAVAG